MKRVFNATVHMAVAIGVAFGTGCSKPDTGPKRADDKAAHTERYHPDIKRRPGASSTRPAVNAGADEAFTQAVAGADSGRTGRPVLFVNGEAISAGEVLEPVIDELTEKSRTENPAAYRERVINAVRNQIDYQISTVIISQQAKPDFKDDKIQEALTKEADRIIRDIVDRRYQGAYARYETHLRQLGLTLDDMKNKAKRHAMVMKFLQDRFKPLMAEPTRKDLLTYYQNNPQEFTTQPKAELFLIEAPLQAELGKQPDRATPQEISAAKQKARARLQQAQQELSRGVDFGEVAKRYCKGVRAKLGGAWGEITPGALTGRWAEAEKVLFTLSSGQTSGIVENSHGLFIVKCGKSTPAYKAPFEEAQPAIIQKLSDEDLYRRQNSYVQQLRSKAAVDKYSEFVQAVLAACPRPQGSRPGFAGQNN